MIKLTENTTEMISITQKVNITSSKSYKINRNFDIK